MSNLTPANATIINEQVKAIHAAVNDGTLNRDAVNVALDKLTALASNNPNPTNRPAQPPSVDAQGFDTSNRRFDEPAPGTPPHLQRGNVPIDGNPAPRYDNPQHDNPQHDNPQHDASLPANERQARAPRR